MRTVRWSIGQRENTPGKGHGLGQGNGAPNKCAEMRNKFELNTYTVSSSSISATVSAALLAIALCKSDIWLQSGKIGEYPTKHIQGAVSMLSCFG